MLCESYRTHFAEWQDGELKSDREQEMKTHLAACADCARAWFDFRQCQYLLSGLAAVEPPRDLVQRIYQKTATVGELRVYPCARVQPLLPAYADGELGRVESAIVLDHALVCLGCQRELRQLQLQIQLLQSVPPVAVPADLKARILAALEPVASTVRSKPSAGGIRTKLAWPWAWGLTAAACTAAFLALTLRGTFQTNVNEPQKPGIVAGTPSAGGIRRLALAGSTRKKSSTRPMVSAFEETPWSPTRPARLASESRGTKQTPIPQPTSKKHPTALRTTGKGTAGRTRDTDENMVPSGNTIVASADTSRMSGDAATENHWLTDRPDEFPTIPQTPLEMPKPATTSNATAPQPKPAEVTSTPKRFVVLEPGTTHRRPLDDIKGGLSANRRSLKEYRITEDKVPSKMLSVNVITMNFK